MARIAKRTTFGTENVGGGVEVRRQIVAGQQVPDHYEVEAGAVDETTEPVGRTGYTDDQITQRVGVDGRVKASASRDEPPVDESEAASGSRSRSRRSGGSKS